jgi:hypothetical protein
VVAETKAEVDLGNLAMQDLTPFLPEDPRAYSRRGISCRRMMLGCSWGALPRHRHNTKRT